MAQADILIADERLLPQAVELHNAIFRPKRELDFFKRRFMGRYNPLTLLARLDNKPVGFWGGFELKPGAAATAEELIVHAREHLAHYKSPRTIVFAEIPRTSTGKIQKFKLREIARNSP